MWCDGARQRYALSTKTVLVTGCTGYVGAFLMESLARGTDVSRVLCLVRAKDAGARRPGARDVLKRAIDEGID